MLVRVAVAALLFASLAAVPALAAPTVTIDSGPGGPTNDTTPAFGFTVADATAVECSVDEGTEAFGPCTDTASHTAGPLTDGDWTFRVRATDDASETATATRDFTVDTTAPNVTIDQGPTGPTNDARPTFGWATGPQNTAECSVDQGTAAFGACSSTSEHTPPSDLPDGDYTFRIRVTDPAGNTASTTRNFSVDTLAPAAQVAGPRKTEDRRPSFDVSSPDPEATLTCRLDSRPEVPCGPTFKPTRRLSYGAHKLVVTAHDAAGNSGLPATLRFRILRPPLEEGRAERTVPTALRRHDFAKRVIENLEQRCERRGRYKFACRFTSAFPGYRLKGHGPVELIKGKISYRFVVRAQGRRVVLTDENEGSFPGKLGSAQHGKP